MHILSDRNYQEFMATPNLVRFTVTPDDRDGQTTLLLVKTTTLQLKYLTGQSRHELLLFRVQEVLLGYAIAVYDGDSSPSFLWSLVEYDDEARALHAVVGGASFTMSLFNEIAVNQAEVEGRIQRGGDSSVDDLGKMLSDFQLYKRPDPRGGIPNEIMRDPLERLSSGPDEGPITVLRLPLVTTSTWKPLQSYYITNQIRRSTLALWEDEGEQQEELATWLIDSLQPEGSFLHPSFADGPRTRELTDVLLVQERTVFLVESKALGVLLNDSLPDRASLRVKTAKHVDKAIRQLSGALRTLRRGVPIFDPVSKQSIHIDLRDPPHVIILVPSLQLLDGISRFAGSAFLELCREKEAFFHFLDPTELLRVVQAGALYAEQNQSINEVGGTDYALLRRAKLMPKQPHANVSVLTRPGP